MNGEANFNKPIDKSTRNKLKKLSKIARVNALKRSRGEQKPENKMLPLLIRSFNSQCFWCEVEVVKHVRVIGILDPPNMATVDHVISRYFRKKGEEVLKVLSCLQCNLERERIDTKRVLEMRKELVK